MPNLGPQTPPAPPTSLTPRTPRRSSTRWLLPVLASLSLCAAAPAAVGDEAGRWQARFDAIPALPATPAQALTKISAQQVQTEGLGMTQLRIAVADPGLRSLQLELDRLFKPMAQASAARMKRAMEAADNDPVLSELARKIDKTLQPDPAHPDKPSSLAAQRELMREVERVLGPMPAASHALPAPRTEIEAYRRELQRATPRAAQFAQRLADQQRRFAQQHAQVDREAMAGVPASAAAAAALVAQHHTLAQRQLADAATVLREASETLAPRVARLVELARAAEQRNAPPHELQGVYVLIKSYMEFLLTLQRDTLQDVGFWAGTRVTMVPITPSTPKQGGTPSWYEHSLAPGFDLRANGEMPYGLPHAYYPIGRAIVVGLPPGIR